MKARKIIANDDALQVDEHHKKNSKMLTKTASKKFCRKPLEVAPYVLTK
jgi:hypothetical protein